MSIKLAILASGRGSNLEAILAAISAGELDAEVKLVLSNNPDAPAIEIAKSLGVPAMAIDSKGINRLEHEKLMVEKLQSVSIDYIVLAGYMRVLTPTFLNQFLSPSGFYRVLNIHPSLLPSFPGQDAYHDAFTAGVRISGITIHLVDDKVDHGPILAQEAFPRLDTDTLDSFKSRGLAVEHKLYPAVLNRIAKEGIKLLPQTSPEKVAST